MSALSLTDYRKRQSALLQQSFYQQPSNQLVSTTVQDVDSTFEGNNVKGSNINYNLIVMNNDQEQLQSQVQGSFVPQSIDISSKDLCCVGSKVHCDPKDVKHFVLRKLKKCSSNKRCHKRR